MPDHAPAVDAQGSTELIEVVDGLRDGEGTVSPCRPAATALLEPYDRVIVREQDCQVSQVVPEPGAAEAEHDRRPRARGRRPELRPVLQDDDALPLGARYLIVTAGQHVA